MRTWIHWTVLKQPFNHDLADYLDGCENIWINFDYFSKNYWKNIWIFKWRVDLFYLISISDADLKSSFVFLLVLIHLKWYSKLVSKKNCFDYTIKQISETMNFKKQPHFTQFIQKSSYYSVYWSRNCHCFNNKQDAKISRNRSIDLRGTKGKK